MKILFVTLFFDPEPLLNGLCFVKELEKLGHEVEVLTGFPNYPGGKLYPGYKVKFFQRETMDGISVIRVPMYPSHDRSSIRRFWTYMSFGLSAMVLGPWLVKKCDIIYVCHPPPTIWLPAWIIRLLHRVPFVYEIHDLWPDALASSTMVKNSVLLKIADSCCRFIYKNANRIIGQNPGFKKELVKRGVTEDKIDVVYHWCDDSAIKACPYDPDLAKQLDFTGKFNIIFAGGFGKGQALSSVLDAALMLRDELPQVQFVFVGNGVEEQMLRNKAEDKNLTNVIFHDRRPMSEIGPILSLADVCLVHLKDNLLHEITVPSKVQAYMCVGKPILTGVAGSATDLVNMACAGISCKPEDSESIADSVRTLVAMDSDELSKMGQNGQEFYERELSMQVGTKHYVDIFSKTIEQFQKR